ncbi:MAG: CDP-diacylglycerol--glycerol-3-phosphate 3-phosphatidyltransferase [Brevibacterium sp.]|nr:CDP-diacylglycerol--glycerol-3-phosphate 3-phosphatidyltransferase [Brevibacterium sp.]MDN5876924.1 CDP-diacylglycerol--glycerol-3-phosphate 3-phosphatidyltransferase [Brevibacterium sp.]MDN5908599.1 CDP-diacylglycerol--glycerol-3-phosphate 3-phosphatidyltransferase [Brevibacterium sp.]MDN6191411.1 CDP-diacylglycerol--glycerol-3-phosphate 3-phosphatidyltransferase [Brevibacterium sp.]MDN6527621.1 CDP-diacylglycerol--glycerol-3-phosphate 3-phosphatidyltransferase [Brevibacterium sp.]
MNDRPENSTPGHPPAEPSPWNVPNALTVLRILLVPVFLVLLLADGGQDASMQWWALAVFLLAMATDKIDGDLARKYNLITNFGKIADPIADKSLMAAALIGLAVIDVLPWWVPIIILIRELGITVLRFFMIRIAVMPASRGGKIKTVLQTVAIGLFILLNPLAQLVPDGVQIAVAVFAWLVMAAAIVVTIVTGVDYCVQAAKLAKGSNAGNDAGGGRVSDDGPAGGGPADGGPTGTNGGPADGGPAGTNKE